MVTGLGEEVLRPAEHIVVGYLSSEYPAISHTFIHREVQALRARGVNVYTASIHLPEHQMNSEETAESARTHYVRNTALWRLCFNTAWWGLRDPRGLWRMTRYALGLKRQAPLSRVRLAAYLAEAVDLLEWAARSGVRHVHVHFANPAATVAMIAAASGKIEFSVSVHGPDVFYDVAGNLLAEKVRRAKFVRCISHYCRSQLMRLTPLEDWNKLHIVRCGIDLKTFRPRPEPGNGQMQIVCVGRLVPAKAQHLLLDACKTLRERGRQFHLTLIGDGYDRESLKMRALQWCMGDCVTFTLGVTPEQVNEHLDRADIMVLPSFAEGLPVVLMEAMAKEVPCVSSRIMGIPELIEHEQNGLLTAPSDLDDLVAQIDRLLVDADLRARLGRRAREKVAAEFRIEQTAERMEALFALHAPGDPP
ncbi:MAG: glycosyltransferase [Candidatus Hydrogenedentes bacterium]|nr:glycosyltransferase [Candidatus Hydrogenedentota bacterium]